MLKKSNHKRQQISLRFLLIGAFVFFILIFAPSCREKAPSPVQEEKPEVRLPEQIPARIHDGTNPDIMVMTLGNVRTPLAEGIFYPYEDRFIFKDEREIKNYFKNTLGIKYYQPIDKSNFPLPPSGWCSWYYYYQQINQEEVKKNAEWLGQNLKQYGAVYCQIDDGWQNRGHGLGENRDWSTIDSRFSGGMDSLASFIKEQGLAPGLWLAPHGQSNEQVVKKSRAFLLTPDGKSASSTWEGKYLVDPSKSEAQVYLRELFTRLAQDWDYEYFKIDGQPIVVDEFRQKKNFMKRPAEPEALYRQTLETIREAIGSDRYLLGCWGIPLEGMGIMNGSRTGGDVVAGWDGFLVAVDATMKYYFLHNIAWYCDPDVMLVRYPLTLDMARAWASLQGLTGQALMASDRMYDLPEERVEILRRVFPAVDIRPFDLFPSGRYKKIWDLKVHHLERQYDVIGCFNFDQQKIKGIELKWKDLGFEENNLYHVYDFWNKEYLGCWPEGFYVEVPPAGVRVLTLLEDNGQPQLISTSRHITQGWVDLDSLSFDPEGLVIRGKSRVIKGDPYELRFAFPRQKRNLKIKRVETPGYNFNFHNHDGWATVTIISQSSDLVSWEVYFEEGDVYNFPARKPSGLRAEVKGLDMVLLEWEPLYYLNAGYNVYVDGKLYLYTPVSRCQVSGLEPVQEHVFEVRGVWLDGSEAENAALLRFKPAERIPREVYLSDLEPATLTSGWGLPCLDRSVSGGPLQIGEKVYKKGIGTHARSEAVFELHSMFKKFEAEVGLDSGSGEKGSVEFIVLADGKVLWRSGIIKGKAGARNISLPIAGVKTLGLVVEDTGDGIDHDHADWAEARIIR